MSGNVENEEIFCTFAHSPSQGMEEIEAMVGGPKPYNFEPKFTTEEMQVRQQQQCCSEESKPHFHHTRIYVVTTMTGNSVEYAHSWRLHYSVDVV